MVQFFFASETNLFFPEMLQLFTLSRLVVLRAMKQVQESASDLLGLMQLSISLVSAVPAVSQAVISLVSLALIFRLQPDSIFFRQLSRVVRWSEINAIMSSLRMQSCAFTKYGLLHIYKKEDERGWQHNISSISKRYFLRVVYISRITS